MRNSPFRLLKPRNGVVPISDVTKVQVARALNDKIAECNALRSHLHLLGRALTAIVKEPESFHYQDGQPYVETLALDRVAPGTALNFDERDGKVYMSVVIPPAKEDAPKIVID